MHKTRRKISIRHVGKWFSDTRKMSEKKVEKGIFDAASCVGIRSIGRGTPDATLADTCHGIGRGIPDAVLVRRRECLSWLISPDIVSDAVKNIDIFFPDVFSLSSTFLCVGSTPVSCSVCDYIYYSLITGYIWLSTDYWLYPIVYRLPYKCQW